MADAHVKYSMTFEDAKAERFALAEYIVVADTTTLAEIVTNLSSHAALAEAISDAQLIKMTATIVSEGLPGGIKAAPVSGSDNEETGLFTFEVTTPVGKAYSIDIPAIAQAVLLSNQRDIDLANSDVSDFVDSAVAGLYNNLWSTGLAEVRAARKTFRKHRRAATRG